MAKIKHTKNELKAQRDALKRFQRYLPTLQLKKQQLQLELRELDHRMERKKAEEDELREEIRTWVRLFAEDEGIAELLMVREIKTSEGNIAGVNIPVYEGVVFDREPPDLFLTPPWIDDGLRVLSRMMELRIELAILREQHRRLADELRVTNQRVNLFEKVKIPEAKENIRVIRIFLGDMQTAEVARAKIAKGKAVGLEAS